mgnify:CR=1 FL=1
MYTYKVTHFDADVLDKDQDKAEKIRAQLEDQLEQHANDGWELQGQYTFGIDIKPGCFGKLTGKSAYSRTLDYLVFRKEV